MLTEFEFIENLKKKHSLTKIGDDCAVIPKDSKTDLVITTDLLVEDIDFRLDWSKPEFIGHKSLAVSLSDVAAMGAKPVWSMVSIGVPERIWKTDFVDEFYKGYLNLAEKYGVELIGGDVSKTPDKIVIDSIAAGEVEKGKAILRSGAKIGDVICVSGCLGGASAGLKLLENGVREENAASWQLGLILQQLAPYPFLEPVEFHPKFRFPEINSLATAMIDISDGLSLDLRHICEASSVGARIFAEKIPLHRRLRGMTKIFEEQLNFAIHGGEDFELLYTKNSKKISASKTTEFGVIGEVTGNVGIIELIIDSKSQFLTSKGFQHF